jgi:chromate transporter
LNTPAQPATLANIFLVFFRIGLFSFGGGLTGWVYREVVIRRHWIEEDEFMSGLAVCQILPGPNITNLAMFIGNRLKGPVGAAASLFALLVGPFFAVIALVSFYSVIRTLPFADTALQGVAVSAMGLLLIVALKGARQAAGRIEAIVAFLAVFVAVGLLHWSLLLVVVVVGPLSVAAAWWRRRRHA